MKHEITERTAVRRLGLITIDLGFEALPGMVWHADTFDFDVQHHQLRATSLGQRIVAGDPKLRESVIKAGQELAADGVDEVATACGYFSVYQQDLEIATGKAVHSSPLMMLPELLGQLPAELGVLVVWAADSGANPAALTAAGIDPANDRVSSTAMPADGAFALSVLGDDAIDVNTITDELASVVTAGTVTSENQTHKVGAVLLECGEMPAFASTLRSQSGPPIYDYNDYLRGCFTGSTDQQGGRHATRR